MLPRTLSVKEAASCLKVQPRTIRVWIAHGRMHASKIGKSYIIPEPEVEKMITATKTSTDNHFTTMTKQERLDSIRGCLANSDINLDAILSLRRKEANSRKFKAGRCNSCQ